MLEENWGRVLNGGPCLSTTPAKPTLRLGDGSGGWLPGSTAPARHLSPTLCSHPRMSSTRRGARMPSFACLSQIRACPCLENGYRRRGKGFLFTSFTELYSPGAGNGAESGIFACGKLVQFTERCRWHALLLAGTLVYPPRLWDVFVFCLDSRIPFWDRVSQGMYFRTQCDKSQNHSRTETVLNGNILVIY